MMTLTKPMVDRCDNDATIELYETHKIDWANQKSAQIPLFLRKVTMLLDSWKRRAVAGCLLVLLLASTS
jgi:hypothetical protein